jgi:hypothetical protein
MEAKNVVETFEKKSLKMESQILVESLSTKFEFC